MDKQALVCSQCGAPLRYARCEYCGVAFEFDEDEYIITRYIDGTVTVDRRMIP